MCNERKQHVAADAVAKYHSLFRAAVDGLEAEDRILAAAISQGNNTHGGYKDVAPGLAYWLFETTLVYVIFRAWVSSRHVAWEHALAPSAVRADAYTEPRRGASEKCDLMLLGADGEPEAAFEAKWWNSALAGSSLLADVKKLRRTCPTIDKFLLTFWTSTDAEKDLKDAQVFCERNGLALVYCASFPTKLVGTSGRFTLGVVHVT